MSPVPKELTLLSRVLEEMPAIPAATRKSPTRGQLSNAVLVEATEVFARLLEERALNCSLSAADFPGCGPLTARPTDLFIEGRYHLAGRHSAAAHSRIGFFAAYHRVSGPWLPSALRAMLPTNTRWVLELWPYTEFGALNEPVGMPPLFFMVPISVDGRVLTDDDHDDRTIPFCAFDPRGTGPDRNHEPDGALGFAYADFLRESYMPLLHAALFTLACLNTAVRSAELVPLEDSRTGKRTYRIERPTLRPASRNASRSADRQNSPDHFGKDHK